MLMLCKAALVALMICIALYAKAIGSLVLTTIYLADNGIWHLFSAILIIHRRLTNHPGTW